MKSNSETQMLVIDVTESSFERIKINKKRIILNYENK